MERINWGAFRVRQELSGAGFRRSARLFAISLLLIGLGCGLAASEKSSLSEKKPDDRLEKLAAELSKGGEPRPVPSSDSASVAVQTQQSDSASVAVQKQQQSKEQDPINRTDTDEFLLDKEAAFASYLLGGEDLEPKPVPAQERERVLRAVYGSGASRSEGGVAGKAEIGGEGEGFTAPNRNETVYLVLPRPFAAADPQAAAGAVLAVFEGGRLTRKIAADGANALVRHMDFDGDGVRELLLQGSFYNMGTLVLSARLVNLRGGKLNVVHDFGVVYSNPCDAKPDGEVLAAILTAEYAETPDEAARKALEQGWQPRKPVFRADYYRAPCKQLKAGNERAAFRPAPDIKKIEP